MRVTAAHEYFHAVQFAYDFGEDLWFMEATATWAEDELFDRVNDNLNYLPYGQIGAPGVPLDSSRGPTSTATGSSSATSPSGCGPAGPGCRCWSATCGVGLGATSTPSRPSSAVLANRGRSFSDTYADFAAANRRARATYAEGRALRYPSSPLRASRTLTNSTSDGASTGTLDHLTSATVRFRRGQGIGPSAKLRSTSTWRPRHAVRRRSSPYTARPGASRSPGQRSTPRETSHPSWLHSVTGSRQVEVTLVNTSSRLGTAYNNQQANVTGTVRNNSAHAWTVVTRPPR